MSFFRRFKKSEDHVIVDTVTGAFNRRQLDRDISGGITVDGTPTATLMIDVNDFESYTGRRGAAPGDQVLERIAWVIMATVRTTDVVYRHSASSFCVLLPSTSDADAVSVADRVQTNVNRMPLLSELDVKITIGVASGAAGEVAGAVDRALAALNRAVENGEERSVDPSMRPEVVEVLDEALHGEAVGSRLAPPVAAADAPQLHGRDPLPAPTAD